MTTCNQSRCQNAAAYRFTWAGRDESAICEHHVEKLRQTAEALGMYLQVIPLAENESQRGGDDEGE